MTPAEKKELRRMVANLLGAAGCSCCRDDDKWEAAQVALAKKLGVRMYPDKSGYDFSKYRDGAAKKAKS